MTAGFEINGPDAGAVASGFVNQTDSTLAFNAGSRTFTIAPAMLGGSFSLYVAGFQFIKSAAETYVWPDTEGLWFIYYDGAGVLQATQNSTLIAQIFSGAGAAVAALYWDAVSNLILREIDERHNIALPGSVHLYLHRYFGTAYESGLALGDFTIVGGVPNTAPPAQFSCANGVVADEDLRRIIADGSPQNLAPVISLPVFYLDGASPGVWRRKAADTFPVIYSGTAGYVGANGRLPWNQLNAGTWQLTEVTNNDFVLLHIFASTDILEPIFGIQGQAVYTSAALARAGALVEINNLANVLALLSTEKRAIGTIIYQTGTAYGNVPKGKVVVTDTGANYVDWRSTAFFAGIASGGTSAPLVFHMPDGSILAPTDLHCPPGVTQRADGVHLGEGAQDSAWDNLNADGPISIYAVSLPILDVSSEYTATLHVQVLFRTQVNNTEISSADFFVDLKINTDGAGVSTVVFQTTPSPDVSRLHTTIMQATCSAAPSAGGFTVTASRHAGTAMQARAFWWATEFVKL